MRYPSDHKQASRAKIVDMAGHLFRERGIASTGVDAVMAGVGLTAGGFYNHFKSKNALVAEVVRSTIRANRERLLAGLGDEDEAFIAGFIRKYVSARHRDQPETGCPITALGSELPHVEESLPVAAEELETYVSIFAERLHARGERTPRQRALALFAMMVGAIVVARTVKGTGLSDEILAACRAVGAP